MGAAVEHPVRLDAMSDDLYPAMRTGGREFMDGTLEAVEDVPAAAENDLE